MALTRDNVFVILCTMEQDATKEFEATTPFLRIVFIVFFLLLVFGGLYFGLRYTRQSLKFWNTPVIPTNGKVVGGSCLRFGVLPKEHYLRKYRAKKGDTPLSIAKAQLNNAQLAGEIVAVNREKNTFPSGVTQVLEQGSELFLPPANTDPTSGDLAGYAGKISDIKNPVKWAVSMGQDTKTSLQYYIYLQPKTQFADKERTAYKAGDCIVVIVAQTGHRTYSVALQR